MVRHLTKILALAQLHPKIRKRMKGKGWLLLGGVGVATAIYEVMRIKEAGDKLEIDPQDVTNVTFGGGKAMGGNINLKVTNPAARSLTVNYLNLHAILTTGINKQEIATMDNQTVSKTFPALSTTTWSIPFTVDLVTLAKIIGADLLALITGKFKMPDSILLTGDVNASGFSVPYNKTIPFNQPAPTKAAGTGSLAGLGGTQKKSLEDLANRLEELHHEYNVNDLTRDVRDSKTNRAERVKTHKKMQTLIKQLKQLNATGN